VGDNLNNDVLAPLALGFNSIYLNRRSTAVPGGVRAIFDWNEFRPRVDR
jgi:FMN phosphatase YigB (HAD superfamily)